MPVSPHSIIRVCILLVPFSTISSTHTILCCPMLYHMLYPFLWRLAPQKMRGNLSTFLCKSASSTDMLLGPPLLCQCNLLDGAFLWILFLRDKCFMVRQKEPNWYHLIFSGTSHNFWLLTTHNNIWLHRLFRKWIQEIINGVFCLSMNCDTHEIL
jgi:hypothetical protein